MLFSKYGEGRADRYLTNEIADAMAAAGVAVDVVVIPWDAPPGAPAAVRVQTNGVRVFSSPPMALGGLGKLVRLTSKWTLSSVVARWRARSFLRRRAYDLVFAMSPLSVLAALVMGVVRKPGTASYAYLVDFFPHHHHALGLVPGGLFLKLSAWLEGFLLRRFDVVASMSAQGDAYLKQHYRLRPSQETDILTLWTGEPVLDVVDRDEVRRVYGLPTTRSIAVFGGQIAEGRGIEEILASAALAETRSDILFLFVGSGPLAPQVRQAQADSSNVVLIPGLGRDRYLELAAACDVGIVCTVSGVDAPTFPSKTLDYLRAGLPIAASVEAATDYGRTIEQAGFGLATEAGAPEKLLDIILSISTDKTRAAQMSRQGRAALSDMFDVGRATAQILSSCNLKGRQTYSGRA